MMQRFGITFALLLLFALPAYTQSKPTWTIEDILRQETLTDLEIAPEGQRIVWVRRKANFDEDRFETDLFLSYLNRKDADGFPLTVQLTRSGNNRAPRWSPDGRYLAFLSSRKSGNDDKAQGSQIWLLDTYGGEPYRLTELNVSVQDFAWFDSTQLVFAARETPTYDEQQRKKQKDDAQAVEDTTEFYPVRLFRIAIDSKKIERLTENEGKILEFAIDPTGRYIVYSIDPHPVDADARHQPRQYLLDLKQNETVEIFAELYFIQSALYGRVTDPAFMPVTNLLQTRKTKALALPNSIISMWPVTSIQKYRSTGRPALDMAAIR